MTMPETKPSFIDRNIPILVADDAPAMRRIIRKCLDQLGFSNVTEVENGRAACESIRRGECGLVIADWAMPEGDGKEIARAAAETPTNQPVPVLLIATPTQRDRNCDAFARGPCASIVKPFTAQLLWAKLEELLAE